MSQITDSAMDQASEMVHMAFANLDAIFQQDKRKALLDKFKKEYDRLDPMTILRAKMALGHRDNENNPCDICQFMASREMKLAQQEL